MYRLRDAVNAHDLDALVDCFTEDFHSEPPTFPNASFTGRENVRRNRGRIVTAVPDITTEVAAVGQLRAAMGGESDDPRMAALVGELSLKSDRFRRLWARQDVVRPAGGPRALHNPEVGELELHREKLIVAGADGQVLVIYHADPRHPVRPGAGLG